MNSLWIHGAGNGNPERVPPRKLQLETGRDAVSNSPLVVPRTKRTDAEAWCAPCEILDAEPHAPRCQQRTVATTWIDADADSGGARGSLVAGDDAGNGERCPGPRPHAPSSTTDAGTRTT